MLPGSVVDFPALPLSFAHCGFLRRSSEMRVESRRELSQGILFSMGQNSVVKWTLEEEIKSINYVDALSRAMSSEFI